MFHKPELKHIFTLLKEEWETWNIRGVVLLSLSLQTLLILFAPFRKRTSNKTVSLLIWSSYLFADWAANFGVGLISNSQSKRSRQSKFFGHIKNDADLLAFWAPFLLLHLGGPDTITAFSLEDNELWLRHLLGLLLQVGATIYVFYQTLHKNSILLHPTLLMFLGGVIKYFERTLALYLGSLNSFRESMLTKPDPGPNYAKLMEEYSSKKDAGLPARIEMTPEPDKEARVAINSAKEENSYQANNLDHFVVVEKAHHFFQIFKGLIVDLIFSFRERNESREFFHSISADSARKVIEVELNFIYEVLYTKVVVVHRVIGYIFRFVSFGSVVVSFGLFYSLEKTHHFTKFDISVTYTLLFGAIGLDAIAFGMLIFSDWTITSLKKFKDYPIIGIFFPTIRTIFKGFLFIKDAKWSDHAKKEPYTYEDKAPTTSVLVYRWFKAKMQHKKDEEASAKSLLFRRWSDCVFCRCLKPVKEHFTYDDKALATCVLVRRWSESVSGFDLIRYSLKERIIMLPENFKLDSCWNFGKFIYYYVQLIHGKFDQFLFNCVNKVVNCFGHRNFLDEVKSLHCNQFTEKLWKFIFEDLRQKSLDADDAEIAKIICSSRGAYCLNEYDQEISKKLLPYIEEVSYDESLLLWHIATDLCFNTDTDEKNSGGSGEKGSNTAGGSGEKGSNTAGGSGEKGSDTGGGSREKGSNTGGGSREKGSDNAGGSGEKGSDNAGGSGEKGSDTAGGSGVKGSDTGGGSREKGSNNAGGSGEKGSDTTGGSGEKGSNSTAGGSAEKGSNSTAGGSAEKGSNTGDGSEEKGSNPAGGSAEKGAKANENLKETDYRKISKILSDYMLYLLVMQPTMMSAVAGIGQIRFRDTCAEADRFFSGKGIGLGEEKKACKSILKVNTDVKPVYLKGDRSKSVLFDACMLAKELKDLDKWKKWEIISHVWVEMLSYAATHCIARTHAQQVSKGGELVSFVWLLMAHFGLGDQFQINEGHARAKLLVPK